MNRYNKYSNKQSSLKKLINRFIFSKSKDNTSKSGDIAPTIMKFIISIFVALTFLCLIFPDDGIPFFGTKLEFPSLSKVFENTTDSTANENAPQDVITKRKSDLDIKKENEFKTFCESNPARIYMPNNDITYLDKFFNALDEANKKHVRIAHFGDSQLECDRISCDLRAQFQSQFGGIGVGIIPVEQTVPTYTLTHKTSPSKLSRGLAYGPSKNRASHDRYGVMGQVTRIRGTVKVNVEGKAKDYPTSASFMRVSVSAKGGSYSVTTPNGTYPLKNTGNSSNSIYSVTMPASTNQATITLNGSAEVYGIMLDGTTGVSLDNIPMRGCSGTIFTSIDSSSIEPYFQHENVKLIILQYGGNSVPYLKDEKKINHYKKQIKQQIEFFKRIEPSACILFIGPADMATKQNGKMASYPQMDNVVTALREAANESGVAFWDMYSSMGGRNSIVKWVNARPQLAGNDHIHFTPKGAKEISEILFNTFQLYYKFYRFRNGLNSE